MPIATAAATIGGSLYSASQQRGAARDGARAIGQATTAANTGIDEALGQARTDQLPWLQAGQNALGMQTRYLAGDYGEALNSPDYAARLSQGIQALDRGAAARGRLYSGGADADRMRFGADTATSGLNSYWDKITGMSSMGQNSASSLGQMGLSAANNKGQNLLGAAGARASGYQQSADANSQAAFGIIGAGNNWYQGNSARNGGGTGFYLGNNPGRG